MILKVLTEVLAEYRRFFTEQLSKLAGKQKQLILLSLLLLTSAGLFFFLFKGSGEPRFDPRLSSELVSPLQQEKIAAGLKNKLIFIDGYHGSPVVDLDLLRSLGAQAYISYEDYLTNENKLWRSGLLIINYAIRKPPLQPRELELIKRYVANGGRLLLLFPAWVYAAYEKKPLENVFFNQLASIYGVSISADYAELPFRIAPDLTGVIHFEFNRQNTSQIFSLVKGGDQLRPLLLDKQGRYPAAAATLGDSRLVAWGQNNFFNGEFLGEEPGRVLVKKILEWLMLLPID